MKIPLDETETILAVRLIGSKSTTGSGARTSILQSTNSVDQRPQPIPLTTEEERDD